MEWASIVVDFVFDKLGLDVTDAGIGFIIWKDIRNMQKRDSWRESIEKTIKGIMEGDKNLDKKRFAKVCKTAIKSALKSLAIDVRALEKEQELRLPQNRETAKARFVNIFKKEFKELHTIGMLFPSNDIYFSVFVESLKRKWVDEQERVWSSLVQSWSGQPSEIIKLENHLRDLELIFDDAFDIWLESGKDYEDQNPKVQL